ncbi:glycosyltransferase family 4 protein [Paraflavitalea soli]|nr:glycosyltransferase family 1 protein [Paraflavitalea soli]
MKIGIDAKWYFNGPVSTRTVLQNLLRAAFELYPEHEWVIFLDEKDKDREFPFTQKNITVQYVWAGINQLSNVFVLPRHMRKQQVEVMVFQTYPSFRTSIPSIAFIHDVLFRDFPQFFSGKERLYFWPLSWLAPKADRLIATTLYVKSTLLKYKYTKRADNIDIVPLGVDERYKPLEQHDPIQVANIQKQLGLPDSYILYVGRLNVRKNIENLLRALNLLKDQQIPLVIVGKEDSKAPDLVQLLADRQLKERIVFTGGISDEALQVVYAKAKLFCFPSFAEGFGLPPLEALASGTPVVVSNSTSLPEVCGDAALYIDPSDPKSIASAINALLDDPVLYAQKRQSGIIRAKEFQWKESAQQFMNSILKATQRN